MSGKLMLLDSNIIIYAAEPGYEDLRNFIDREDAVVSIISKIEVLGYYNLSSSNKAHLEEFFSLLSVLPLSDNVVECAITLRQKQKMSLGDALIAATALEHELKLVTANSKDFTWINGLKLHNPLK